MRRYLIRRLLLVIPTLFGIIALNFCVAQTAPGGPVDALLSQYHQRLDASGAIPGQNVWRGANAPGAATRAALARELGFDKPPLTRFWLMLRGYLTFHLGRSLVDGTPVTTLILARLPVSLSLGLWSTLLVYAIAVPLGAASAMRAGGRFDRLSRAMVLALYAVPGFLVAILGLNLFGQGGRWPALPLRGLTSGGAIDASLPGLVADYAWHMVLPTLAMTLGGLASLTMLTRNSVLAELPKLYVLTARAKGAGPGLALRRHALPNALLLIIAGLPAAATAILFSQALLVEIIFSLPGLGLLGYDAILQRDDPVIFGTLYVYTLTSLVLRIIGDLLYAWLDPRIDFDGPL
ncbi:MAG: ABC transporter permease subunit [Acidocella sp.]|nr:ABC transporter permease subunit [Acidocella sp.]